MYLDLRGYLEAALAGLLAAAVITALLYRADAIEAAGQRDLAIAQAKVLAESTRACSEGVALAKKMADSATALGGVLLAQAKDAKKDARTQAAKLEALLKRPTPAGAGCDDAWQEIEQMQAQHPQDSRGSSPAQNGQGPGR